jgi:hypothetical protein
VLPWWTEAFVVLTGGGRQLSFRRGGGAASAGLDVNLLVTMVKYGGEDLLGMLPRRVRLLYDSTGTLPPPTKDRGMVPVEVSLSHAWHFPNSYVDALPFPETLVLIGVGARGDARLGRVSI